MNPRLEPAPPHHDMRQGHRPTGDAKTFAADVVEGLSLPRKRLDCKYLYDERGAALFKRICDLEEYYPTRAELQIMRQHAPEMGETIGPDAMLIEFGTGSGEKTRQLLNHVREPAGFVPVDIAGPQLAAIAESLAADYPRLEIVSVHADFTAGFDLPELDRPVRRRVVYFPGSTIGNFDDIDTARLFYRLRRMVGDDGGLLIGLDLMKEPSVLHAAYNDAAGVTAEFNRNILHRINRELDGTFAPDRFAHYAFYNPERSRMEMHLISQDEQVVYAAGEAFHFRLGESIHTENSYKYDCDAFAEVATPYGFTLRRTWPDSRRWFCVQFYDAC